MVVLFNVALESRELFVYCVAKVVIHPAVEERRQDGVELFECGQQRKRPVDLLLLGTSCVFASRL